MDGKEALENTLGRAPRGRSDTEATIGWTEREPWEIAWGELRWEGAIQEATRMWTDGKPWEIALGRAALVRERDPREIAWGEHRGSAGAVGELRWRERDGSAGRAWAGRVARVFRDNFNQCDCPEKCGSKTWK